MSNLEAVSSHSIPVCLTHGQVFCIQLINGLDACILSSLAVLERADKPIRILLAHGNWPIKLPFTKYAALFPVFDVNLIVEPNCCDQTLGHHYVRIQSCVLES